jgi:spore maturation protein CgeB
MSEHRLRIVILGLSITSSWGNGHATTYRALVRELAALGHDVLFLERDVPWYAEHRDLPTLPYARVVLYRNLRQLKQRFASRVRTADLVVVGSYVPDGAAIGTWVTRTARGLTAFYDIDTPVTLARLARGDLEYLTRALIRRYDLYLSFTGGPTLERLEREFGAQSAHALYCSVDPATYYPEPSPVRYDLAYMGTYSADRQRALTHLLSEPARLWWDGRFAVAGPQYPASIRWPANVRRVDHVPPDRHRAFYGSQRFTLNLTRSDMIASGYSPSVRLFEAAACGTPIISDAWSGLEEILEPGREVLLARNAQDTLGYLRDLSETERLTVAARARARILAEHTAAHRAEELEALVVGALARPTMT